MCFTFYQLHPSWELTVSHFFSKITIDILTVIKLKVTAAKQTCMVSLMFFTIIYSKPTVTT